MLIPIVLDDKKSQSFRGFSGVKGWGGRRHSPDVGGAAQFVVLTADPIEQRRGLLRFATVEQRATVRNPMFDEGIVGPWRILRLSGASLYHREWRRALKRREVGSNRTGWLQAITVRRLRALRDAGLILES